MTEERAYWLAWSKVPGVGPVLLKRIQQHFGTLQGAWNAAPQQLGGVDGLGAKIINEVLKTRSHLNPPEFLQQHRQKNPNFWTPADPEYPRLLWEIPSPPPVLYYEGTVNLEENQGITPLVAMVGTRYPTEHGRRWTRQLSKMLANHGFTIVSGMAAGIDGDAHRGCLEVKGRTIAVLGTGVEQVYPPIHRQLYEEIKRAGLLLSEYAANTKVKRGNFPARNRIIAGLSRAVLVMEAPEKSGSLITARYANEFGRDVYTLPNSPEIMESKGCLKLLHQGAGVIIEPEELLKMLGGIPQLDQEPLLPLKESKEEQKPLPALEPELAKVLQAVTEQPTSFDLIVQQTEFSANEVSGALLQLELQELVTQLPGMRYQRK